MSEYDCNELVELVTAFLDGALSDADEQAFVDHLSICDGCEAYLAQFRRTIATLGDTPAQSLPGDTREALLAAFREKLR